MARIRQDEDSLENVPELQYFGPFVTNDNDVEYRNSIEYFMILRWRCLLKIGIDGPGTLGHNKLDSVAWHGMAFNWGIV